MKRQYNIDKDRRITHDHLVQLALIDLQVLLKLPLYIYSLYSINFEDSALNS